MLKLIFTNELSLDKESLKERYINKIENTIIKYNSDLLKGITYVSDDTYDNCVELLTLLSGNSPVLADEKKVHFVKEFNEGVVEKLENMLTPNEPLQFYLNPVGLNVRLVYKFGELVEARTVGRSIPNRNILDLMVMILTNRNDNFADIESVEIYGTLIIPFDNLNMVEEFCQVTSPYQALFALIHYNKESNAIENLEDIVYFLATDISIEGIPFESITEKYELLDSNDFQIPEFFEKERGSNLVIDLESAMDDAEFKKYDYPYQTNGLRLLTNTNDIVLLKQGSWGIKAFTAVVKDIEWVDEKCKKVPKLIFEEEIEVEEGYSIKDFVLNSINLLLILNISIGGVVRFAYFGDMGFLPITEHDEIVLNG